ncbi:zinc ribbon domain-containing protein [Hydrogenibacillus schlegelii]|uniref:zinc ribbon domain-containing protein n=1 Tax=Hydrogenibacillus schlegelii TaxID=1484 RepID=UPI000826E592|nr:zinc ribbon domain-containing protein [Hydrogenibacillus schlegelii]
MRIVKAGRFEPTSKMCSSCGYVLPELPLSVRAWTCPACGTHHDRDENAAKNLLRFALTVA